MLPNQILHLVGIRDISGSYFCGMKMSFSVPFRHKLSVLNRFESPLNIYFETPGDAYILLCDLPRIDNLTMNWKYWQKCSFKACIDFIPKR